MNDMTTQPFDTTAHPRNTSDGRFVESTHSAPEGALVSEVTRATDAQSAINAATGGRSALALDIAMRRFDYGTFAAQRKKVWADAGGPQVPLTVLERYLPHRLPLEGRPDPDQVEASYEVTYHRARSGRYIGNPIGGLHVTPVDEAALRAADSQAASNARYVEEMWREGRQVGSEAEVTAENARLFAEHQLQNLPEGHSILDYPRLAEMANEPYSGDDGASHAKVDALHAELHRIREAGWLSGNRYRRLDALSTFALHGDTTDS